MAYSDEKASTSLGYHPYLVCSTFPGLSGAAREQKVNELFQNTPGLNVSQYYPGGNLFHNDDTVSCGIVRAHDDTILEVYAANPGSEDHMSVNPMHSSMKMVENTVEVLSSWFDDDDEIKAVVSVGSSSPALGDNTIQVEVMNLKMLLCPGVQDFAVDDVPDDQIRQEIIDFVAGDGGETVKSASFYHHRATGMDGDDAVHTERIDQWSAAVTNVTGLTKEDGSNICLDNVIKENMEFNINGASLEVTSELSTLEAKQLAESLGWTEEGLETCIWYLTYAMGVCPMVCSVQTDPGVKTLCKDGTSDLSKCPPSPAVPADPAPAPPTSSSSSWTRSVGYVAAARGLMALFVSVPFIL